MRPRVRVGDVAVDLRRHRAGALKRKHRRALVAGLRLQAAEIDRFSVEPGRCSGLQAPERQPQIRKPIGKAHRRRIAGPAAGSAFRADMDDAAQEGSGGQNHCRRPNARAGAKLDTGDPAQLNNKINNFAFNDREVAALSQFRLHMGPVQPPVTLSPRTLHRRSLAPVQEPELDPGQVGDPAHHAIQRIDLTHQVSLTQPADCRIARHLADAVGAVGHQSASRSHPRRRMRRLGARMPAADHHHIEAVRAKFHVKRSPFTRAFSALIDSGRTL